MEKDNQEFPEHEFQLLLEEYRIVTAQILHRLDSDNRGFELNILVTGAVLSASALIVDRGYYTLLLLLTLPFYVLVWEQIRRVQNGRHMISYVSHVLAPRLSLLIHQETFLNSYGKSLDFISWERYMEEAFKKEPVTGLSFLLPQAGKVATQFGASIILLFIYFFFRQTDTSYQKPSLCVDTSYQKPSLCVDLSFLSFTNLGERSVDIDKWLLVMNLLLIVISLALIGITVFTKMRYSESKPIIL